MARYSSNHPHVCAAAQARLNRCTTQDVSVALAESWLRQRQDTLFPTLPTLSGNPGLRAEIFNNDSALIQAKSLCRRGAEPVPPPGRSTAAPAAVGRRERLAQAGPGVSNLTALRSKLVNYGRKWALQPHTHTPTRAHARTHNTTLPF